MSIVEYLRKSLARLNPRLLPGENYPMNLQSREFFLRHSREPASFGLRPLRHSYYEVERPGHEPATVRSMLSTHEIGLCYAVAKFAWNGEAIVDLGPLMGASTWGFARGLSEREEGPSAPVIHSFDIWRATNVYEGYLAEFPRGAAGSLLGQWVRTLAGYHHLCEPHQGDFLQWTWDGRPIGILFVDIAKSWALHDRVVSTMFPCLAPGSILMQQDYIHWNEYWIHLEMARMRDFFRPCQFLRGSTAFYQCIRTPPAELCSISVSSLPYATQVEMIEDERSRAPEPVREVMKTAAAKHAIENGDLERARSLLASVDFAAKTDDGILEVSGIAKSNHERVASSLAEAEKKSSLSFPH